MLCFTKVNLFLKEGNAMQFTFGEKVRIVLSKREMTLNDLAMKIGQSSSNLSNKLKRNNFSENEMKQIAAALNCTFEPTLIMNDTGERL